MATNVLLLDACSLLNLYASRHFRSILSLPYNFAVAEKVREEALYVYRGGNGEEARERENVDIQEVISVGLLRVVACETNEETALYVSYAAQLDDGEAMTCAIAICRGYSIVTDDGKAVALMNKELPPVPCFSTLEILKKWSEEMAISPATLTKSIADIQARANYFPAKKHPLKPWWDAALVS